MQLVTSRRSPTYLEPSVYMGNSTIVKVDFLRIVRLQLTIEHFLELHDVSYIPSIIRNLIAVSILDGTSYSFLFGSSKVKLYRDSILISNGMLSENLYKLNLVDVIDVSSSSSLNVVGSNT